MAFDEYPHVLASASDSGTGTSIDIEVRYKNNGTTFDPADFAAVVETYLLGVVPGTPTFGAQSYTIDLTNL